MSEKKYIDADEFIGDLRKEVMNDPETDPVTMIIFGLIEKAIEEFPTADVAPVVHGHWKKCKPDALIWWECSVCGVPHYLDEPRDVFYCPYCGAKMDEEVSGDAPD